MRVNLKTAALGLALVAAPSIAAATCPDGSSNLLSCTFKNGATSVSTCMAEDMVLYFYGPTGKAADLAMIRNVRDVDMLPWNGIGRTLWESFSLSRGAFSYELFYAIDRLTEGNPIEAGLSVRKNGQVLATLSCDPESIDAVGYPLPIFDAKLAAGQEWDMGEGVWRDPR